ELSPRLPERAIITSDSGSCANWYARDLKMRRGMKASLSGGLASMGAAVPYAIAAKYAQPDRPVIALVGDGAMQMNNMAELITVAKYWRDWQDHRWIVCVFNNEDLNQVTWEQRIIQGDPKFEAPRGNCLRRSYPRRTEAAVRNPRDVKARRAPRPSCCITAQARQSTTRTASRHVSSKALPTGIDQAQRMARRVGLLAEHG